MRIVLIFALTFLVSCSSAQINTAGKSEVKKGFIVGAGLGAGFLTLKKNDTVNVSFSTTFPNIKVGYMLNSRLALLVLLPGANYKYSGKDRGFEGLVVAGQYWIKDSWWLMGGAGLTFDAPAFYTVKDPKTAGFYTGLPSFTFATGYEIWHKGHFALDLQYRIFIGQSDLPDNKHREGISNMLIVEFNWY